MGEGARWCPGYRAGGGAAGWAAQLPQVTAETGWLPLDGVLQQAAQLAAASPLPSPDVVGGSVVWTDGSCVDPRDPLLARAAWAFVAQDGSVQVGPVRGRQTAQRAEAAAVLAALRATQGDLLVVTDSQQVLCVLAQRAAGQVPPDLNHDLWGPCWAAAVGR